MRPAMFSGLVGTGLSTFRTIPVLIALGLSVNAMAQMPDDPWVPYANGCPADSVGDTLNCTADDVSVALVTAEDEAVRCITGYPAMLNLDTVFEINSSSERDDIAAWIPTVAELGKNMLLPSGSGGPLSCVSKAFETPIYADPAGTGPLVVENLDGDQCGDANGTVATFTQPFTDAEVQCEGAVGGAEVDALVSWHLSGNDPVCTDHKEYGGFKKSKCSYTTSFVDLAVVGQLEICKSADSDQNFFFNIAGGMVWQAGTGADLEPIPAETPFILNPVEVACMTFDVMTHQPGEGGSNVVTITEDALELPGDFDLTGLTCSNNTPGGGPVAFERDGYSLIIELTEGDLGQGGTNAGQSDVTCTFINTEGGSLTIQKDTLPTGSPQSFTFTHDLTVEPPYTFDLVDGGAVTFDSLNSSEAPPYNVTEAVPAGWTLVDVTCTNAGEPTTDFTLAGSTLTIDVGPGENFVCTFHNVQEGRAIVRKEVLPIDDLTMFDFSGGDITGQIAGGGELSMVMQVPPGAYTATEVVPVGWDLASVVCDDGNSVGAVDTATFNIEPGEVVTCIFTNVKQGVITVEKNAIGGDDSFNFLLSWLGSPLTIDTAVSTTFTSILPASDEVAETTYSATEDTSGLEAARWNYDGSVCTSSLGGTEDNDAIDLDPGETVTCVYTNTKWSSITIVKEARGPDDEFCFIVTPPDMAPSGGCLATVDGYFEETSDNVPLGQWSFEEILDVSGNWVLASATCDNGDDPAALNIDAGEDVTCTFVNILPNPVPVNSLWALLLMVLMVMGAGWYFRPAGLRK